jgi:hypothetical protein
MLDHYCVRPKTADRIRALWLGPAIDQYAAWTADRGAAKATVTRNLQALIHFDRFAKNCGATAWTDLPALIDPFVDHWMREHGAWCTGARARQSLRSHPRTPVEQMLRLLVPGFVGTTTRRPVPFHETAPISLSISNGSGASDRRRCISTFITYASSRRIFDAAGLAPSTKSHRRS